MSNLRDFFNTETRAPTYLLQDLLPASAVVYFSGPRKRGFKTFAQKFMTLVAASGRPYKCGNQGKPDKKGAPATKMVGEPVILTPTKPCRILSFQQEGTAIGNKERIGKIGLGLGEWDRQGLLYYRNSLGFEDYKITDGVVSPILENFHFYHRPGIKFHNPESMKRLHSIIDLVKPDITVLDAITYMHNGKENDPENMLAMVDGLFSIRAKGGTVVAVMHTSKEAQRNTEVNDIDLDLRGHSSQLDAYDAHFGFRRLPANKGKGWIDLICRYREREEQQFKVRWEIPKLGLVEPIHLHMVRCMEE